MVDLPRLACFVRAWKRYFRYRGKSRPDMAEGCDEKMDLEFMWWILWKGRRVQKKKWLAAGLENYMDKVTVLKSQKEIDRYLEGLSC